MKAFFEAMSHIQFPSVLLFLALSLLLSSCSSNPKQSCNTVDWFEIGRQDGVLGKQNSSYESSLKSCEGQLGGESLAQYKSGRNSGLVDYCSRSNAWELGRTGQGYSEVCPDSLRKPFLEFYHRGRKLYEMERQNSQLSEEINDISFRLKSDKVEFVDRILLTTELEELKARREQLERRMSRLQISTVQ